MLINLFGPIWGDFDPWDGDISAVDMFWLIVAILLLHAIYLAVRWRWLGKQLFSEDKAAAGKPVDEAAREIDAELLHRVFRNAGQAIAAEAAPASATLLAAWKKAEGGLRKLAEAAEPVVRHALESAQLDSVLVSGGDDYLYVVAVPSRHEHAHLLRRHAAMKAGWPAHLNEVRSALAAGHPFSSLLGFLLFFSPDSRSGVLLLSWADATRGIVPAGLATRKELSEPNVLETDVRLEFAIASQQPALVS